MGAGQGPDLATAPLRSHRALRLRACGWAALFALFAPLGIGAGMLLRSFVHPEVEARPQGGASPR